MKNNKRILDSVHGYIEVPDLFFEKIIDTVYFQRLRRIEQTSSRALFPSARHDRFIHSLGVYHIGDKIIQSLTKRGYMEENNPLSNKEKVVNSYKLACLLHDIAHSPFSHTFEDFYQNNKTGLDQPLLDEFISDEFKKDYVTSCSRSASHEKMSALVAYKIFKPKFNGFHTDYGNLEEFADWELIVRMICGIYYSNDEKGIENCLIDLIHGDVIDADGLDYVCRDAWASGYQTSNVDIDRLIDSIEINRDKKGAYHVAFTAKALNEIEAVLTVKNFQQYHVINHHTVTYEQNLLKEAVQAAAKHFFKPEKDIEPISKLCCIDSFFGPVKSDDGNFSIYLPMDDDFIHMMKSCLDEPLVNEWFSRDYRLVPVWKSRAEFYNIFESLRGCKLSSKHWLFSNNCTQFLKKELKLKDEDIRMLKASPKYKGSFADKVYIKVKDDLVKYIDLFPGDKNSFTQPSSEFYYLFVAKTIDLGKLKKLLIEEVEKYIIIEKP